MSLRVLHVLDHSIPLHSGYSFRTLAILKEQRALGWETVQLTSPSTTTPRPTKRTATASISTGRGYPRQRCAGHRC